MGRPLAASTVTMAPQTLAFRSGAITRAHTILSSYYRAPGTAYGLGMAIAHALRCLKRTHYDDAPQMRLRRHLILYGPRGSCKSSCSKYFLLEIAGCLDLVDAPDLSVFQEDGPKIVTLGGGTSFERVRGTFGAGGDIMEPLIQEAAWVYAPELLTVLGHHPQDRSKRIEDFNSIVEEGRITVALAKGGNKDLAEREEMAKRIPEGAAYVFNPRRATITYDCTAAFLGCTRPLPEKLLAELNQSGYWSRHDIWGWDPTDDQAATYADNKFGPPPSEQELKDARSKFLDLWATPFKFVNAPPKELLSAGVQWYNQELMKVREETEVPFVDLFSSRDDTDIAQLLTASALDRLSASREPGDRSPVERIEYDPRDLVNAKLWLRGRLSHLRSSLETEVDEKTAKGRDDSVRILMDFFNHMESERDPDPTRFNSRDFVAHFVEKKRGGASTARRHLSTLKRARMVRPMRTSPGEYHIEDEAIRRMGKNPDDYIDDTPHIERPDFNGDRQQ